MPLIAGVTAASRRDTVSRPVWLIQTRVADLRRSMSSDFLTWRVSISAPFCQRIGFTLVILCFRCTSSLGLANANDRAAHAVSASTFAAGRYGERAKRSCHGFVSPLLNIVRALDLPFPLGCELGNFKISESASVDSPIWV